MGYSLAGFDVIGIDIAPPKNYPFKAIQHDVPTWLYYNWEMAADTFDLIHASPPCQAFSSLKSVHKDIDHPDLIQVTRQFLHRSLTPYVIENVPRAPLVNPIMLCGTMFGLRLFRHRMFEIGNVGNAHVMTPVHQSHRSMGLTAPKTSREPDYNKGEVHSIYGHFSGVERARIAMGVPWMTRDQMSQAIPPAYTKFIGDYLVSCGLV